jgi:hypothetical protein
VDIHSPGLLKDSRKSPVILVRGAVKENYNLFDMEDSETVKWVEYPITTTNSYPIKEPKAKFKSGGPKPFYEDVLKKKKRRN